MDELRLFIKPLFLTLLFECAAAFLLGIRNRKDQLLILLVNIITNPVLVLFSLLLMYHLGIGKAYLITYLIMEPIVVYVEYRFYREYLQTKKDPLLLSVLLNVISIIGGIICRLF